MCFQTSATPEIYTDRPPLSLRGALPICRATMGVLVQQVAAGGDEPTALRRTSEGRSASDSRYHNAEEFFSSIEEGFHRDRSNLLYQTGIVMPLGLSAHLLDICFADRWYAQNLWHRVATSPSSAPTSGLGSEGRDLYLTARSQRLS